MTNFFSSFKGNGNPLQAIRVDVDKTSVMEGKSVCFKCIYSLRKEEKVTDISWYHDNKPIYEYGYMSNMPKETLYASKDYEINVSMFILFQIIDDISSVLYFARVFSQYANTNYNTLALDILNTSASGTYSCEVAVGDKVKQRSSAESKIQVTRK